MRFSVSKALALLVLFPLAANGQLPPKAPDLPPVNLGFTSFVDGGAPAGPGFYFQQYVQYYSADNFRNADGDEARLPPAPIDMVGPLYTSGRIMKDLDLMISLSQFIYQSDRAILPGGGRWGIDFIIPLIGIDVDPGPARLPNGDGISDNNEGMGDIVIGPYIQWDPIMGKNGPLFMQRIEFQNIIPTGKYDDGKLLNPGSNFYSFNPYWAATFFATPQWTITWRLHYLWNAKNNDPAEDLWGNADDTQAGQAIHVNFASAYEVLPQHLRVGLNGYYLEQITNSKLDGKTVHHDYFGPGKDLSLKNLHEQVLGLGPGAVYHFSPEDHLFFNAYFEMESQARTEGMRFTFRWTHHF
jgi:hypothetical protein